MLTNSILLLLVGVFLWTRLYRLPETFDLFGDSARDLLELAEWRTTLKPPLLGPHTSAISFNQSAWYFYYLFPFYVVSGQSLYTSQIAIIVWYLGWLYAGFRYGEKYGLAQDKLILLWAIIVFHPFVVAQTRTVWNPSMVLPLMLAALVVELWWLTHVPSKKQIFFWALCVMFAVGFSYSVIPAVGLMVIAGLLLLKKYRLWLLTSLFAAVVLVNIGTIGYEFKYHFLLTKNLPNQQVLQTSSDVMQKLVLMTTYLFGIRQ